MKSFLCKLPYCLLTLLASSALRSQDDAKLKALLEKVASTDPDVRMASRAEASSLGAPAVVPLAKLMNQAPDSIKDDSVRIDIMTTARLALDRLVHHAGRPGADAEKKAVLLELQKLVSPEQPDKVKREGLSWLAAIGDDAAVPSVAKLLSDKDKHVRETARLALERIPGEVAVKALSDAATARSDDFKNDLIFSVGKKGDVSAVAFLKATAQSSKGKTRLAALEGLARLAAADSVPFFMAALSEQDLPERAAVFNELLRLADNLAQIKIADGANSLYREALSRAPQEHQRERALFRLLEDAPQDALNAALTGLSDSSVRVSKLALSRLEAMKGPEVTKALKKSYDEAKPEARPVILRALHSKDPTAATPLVEAALTSSQSELKVTALDLAGKLENVALEPLYLEVAEKGSPSVKLVAMKALLLVAKKRQSSGEAAQALKVYTRALELASADEDRVEAVRGVVAVGDPKAIETLSPLLKDPLLGAEAAKGVVAFASKMGAAGSVDAAEAQLKPIVAGEFPRDVRGQAAEELRKLGRDPQAHLTGRGFVVKWWLVGPMENAGNKGLETKFFPEEVIDLVTEQRIEARRFRWQEYKDLTLDGVIDLVPVFRRSDNRVAYAYTEIESPKAKDVVFKIGSDEGVAVWLNGQRIHFNNAVRALKIDEDTVKAHLEAGKNKVLVKIANTNGPWAFVFRMSSS